MTGKPHGAELPVSLAKRITAALVETENAEPKLPHHSGRWLGEWRSSRGAIY